MNKGKSFGWSAIVFCLVLCVALTGCKDIQAQDTVSLNEMEMLTAHKVTFSGTRSNMALYQTKLLYMEMDQGFHYYVYDFETSKNKKVRTLRNVVVQDANSVLVEDKLYFSVHGRRGREIYIMDFSSDTVKRAPDIPSDASLQTEYDGQLLVRRKNDSDHETEAYYLEKIDSSGERTRIELHRSDANDVIREPSHMDHNGEHLCLIETELTDSEPEVYFTQYDSNFTLANEVEITHLLSEHSIRPAIGRFYAFGDYFCIEDYDNNMILCRLEQNEVSVLLSGMDLAYAENDSEDASTQYFYRRRTNEMYALNTQTGEIALVDFALENDAYVIRHALAYENNLLINKKPLSEDVDTEDSYLITVP